MIDDRLSQNIDALQDLMRWNEMRYIETRLQIPFLEEQVSIKFRSQEAENPSSGSRYDHDHMLM